MKKALSLILVLVMLIGLMPMQVFATEGTQETEAVEVVTEPTEAPEEETTAPTENTEITEESTEEATESEEADEPVMPLGLEPINSQWSGKTAAFVGDSITAGSGTTKIYYQYLEEAIGFRSVMAMGVAGSCISIASDYGTGNQPLINRYQNIPEADLIVVFMGTNDYGHETPLGSVVDEQDGTFYGALNVIVPALVAKHPFSKIVFVTPLHRYGFGTSKILGTQFTSDDVANGVGATLGDYVDALKTVCANNGVSVIDLYTECTLDPADVEVRSVYMPDGLHPNATGHEVIAEIMASHIRGYEPTEKEPEIDPEPEEETELIYGNKFASGFTQQNRASARVNQYLKAGTVITLKKPEIFQWSCAKTSGETSSNNLGYFPGSAWTDQETAVVKADGWVGFVFKYRDETQFFDLTKPLSDYITIEEPHTHNYGKTVTAPTCTEQGYTTYTCACGDSYVADYVDATGHTYKNGICTGCGEEDYDGLDLNGLNVLCLGDSITAGQGLTTETRWTNVLASKYGWNLTNKSQGGISLSSYYYTTNGTTDVSIAKKAEVLKTMTTKPDVIIVWGGHNDTGYRYSPLGTWDDETADSFKGALKYIAELAEEYAPDATLFVLTPFLLNETPSTLKVPANTSDNNWMFVDAIYDGAEAYGWIPVNMDLCGITPFTKSGLLLDTIHPNEAGTEMIVEYLSEELAGYGANSKKESIVFDESDVSMKIGESTILKAVLSPRSGTGTMTFTWSSSDSSVATVDADGKITAVAPGTAFVTATATNGTSANVEVSVVCDHTYENGTCTGCGATVSPYLQQLPENVIGCTNLYDVLTPVKGYYTAAKYDTSNGEVLSVVIPVEPGDRIAASSFASKSENMGSVAGIRVTYLLGDKIVLSLSAGDVYNSYTTDGYITVPDGVDAVCVPWWKPSSSNWLTLGQISRDFVIHSPKPVGEQAPTCTESGYTAGEICGICNASLSEREEIPATGHSYSGKACTRCGALDLKAILGGKHVSVLGDSISTFNGYSNDASVNTTIGSNGPRYDVGTADSKPGSYCLLESVNDTWWMDFANRSGMNLLVNNSWAGSQVFGGKTSDGRVIPAAYLDRCVNLHDNTLENNPRNEAIDPDVIFVYLGINDYNFNRTKVGSGTVDYAGLVNSSGTYVTPANFGEAYGIMLHKIQMAYPDARIFAMTLLPENLYSVDMTAWEQHNAYIRAAAEYYDIPVVDLAANCAITWENYSGYMMDKIHPTTAGMKLICDCIEAELQSYYTNNPPHVHTYENGMCTVCGEAQPGPVITQQPESVEQEIGKKFAITVKAVGEGLTYQWYVKEAGAKAFKVSVNKTASYAYTMQDYMHNRQVYCVVTDANGNSIQTETATITRPPQALRIVEQPQDARVNVGEKFSISPKVEGEGLTYQWYVKESGAKAFKVSSIKGSAYALTMQKYMIGRQVYCVITDKYGNSVTTDVATISLPPVELKILEQPSDVYAVKGEKFSISFVVQGDGLTYQWYYKESYMKDFKPSSNKTSAYAYSMQNYMDGRSVYCVITDQYGNQVVTEAVTIHLEK